MSLRRQRVDHLVHAGHGHRQDVHDLGLATLEQTRTVSGRQDADFGGHGTEIGDATAIHADALVDDPATHELLAQRTDRFLDHAVLAGELARLFLRAAQLGDDLGRDGVGRGVALGLGRDDDDRGELVAAGLLDGGEDLRRVVEDRGPLHLLDRAGGRDDRGDELTLQRDRFLDPHLAGLEAVGEDFLGDLLGAVVVVVERVLGATGFDHHHGDVAVVELTPGDDEFERAGFGLFVRGVGDPLAVDRVGHADGADRALEGDTRDHQRGRSGVDRQDVERVVLVGTEDRRDDLGLVAEAVGERRAQRPVGEAAGEDRVLARTTFATEERAGDLAGRVRPLLDVDRQREEVHAFTHALGGVGGGEDLRPTDGRHDGAHRLGGKLARFEGECLVGSRNGSGHDDWVSHRGLLSMHGGPSSCCVRLVERRSRFPVGDPERSIPLRTGEFGISNRQPTAVRSVHEIGPSDLGRQHTVTSAKAPRPSKQPKERPRPERRSRGRQYSKFRRDHGRSSARRAATSLPLGNESPAERRDRTSWPAYRRRPWSAMILR